MTNGDDREDRPRKPQEERLTTADLAGGVRRPEEQGEPARGTAEDGPPLFPSSERDELRGRWDEIQTSFVDEPRRAVEEADALVARAMKRLAETFAEERAQLENQWDRGDDVSTEDLRVALQRYRAFFSRLLSI